MKRVARTNQGGSAITFIIVGAILLVALAAGVYWAYQRGADVQSGAPMTGSTSEKATPAPEKSGEQTKDKTDSGTMNKSGQEQSTATQPGVNTGEIPQTGPSNAVYTLVIVLLVTFAATLYMRSRVNLHSL